MSEVRASEIVKINLDDPRAANCPFTFKKGDIVVQPNENGVDLDSKGEIIDGVYEGSASIIGGFYDLIYTVQRLKDATCYDARALHLEAS